MDFVGDSAWWMQLWFDSNHNQCFCYFPGAALRIFLLFPNSLERINEKRAAWFFLRVVMLNLFYMVGHIQLTVILSGPEQWNSPFSQRKEV